jgi:hypothetical protein
MIRLRRTERATRLSNVDATVTLTETNWSLIVRRRGTVVGALSYRSPTTIILDGLAPIRIRDYLLLARLGAVVAMIALSLRALNVRK